MSDEYKIIIIGKEYFTAPYAMLGLDIIAVSSLKDAVDSIKENNLESTLFIIDEDIILDIKLLDMLEHEGAHLTMFKNWGVSNLASNKIRNASIKAIGVDILDENRL